MHLSADPPKDWQENPAYKGPANTKSLFYPLGVAWFFLPFPIPNLQTSGKSCSKNIQKIEKMKKKCRKNAVWTQKLRSLIKKILPASHVAKISRRARSGRGAAISPPPKPPSSAPSTAKPTRSRSTLPLDQWVELLTTWALPSGWTMRMDMFVKYPCVSK